MAFWAAGFWKPGFWKDNFWQGMSAATTPVVPGQNDAHGGGGGGHRGPSDAEMADSRRKREEFDREMRENYRRIYGIEALEEIDTTIPPKPPGKSAPRAQPTIKRPTSSLAAALVAKAKSPFVTPSSTKQFASAAALIPKPDARFANALQINTKPAWRGK